MNNFAILVRLLMHISKSSLN